MEREDRDSSPSIESHCSTVVQPVPELDKKFFSRDRNRIHGYYRYFGRYQFDADGKRNGNDADCDGLLLGHLVDYFSLHELV